MQKKPYQLNAWLNVTSFALCLLLASCGSDIFNLRQFGASTCDEAAVTSFGGGAGTDANPYLICSNAQLDLVRLNLSAHYQLMKDIDLSAVEFAPLGDDSAVFSGSFNGNGFRIQNWTYTDAAVGMRAFFPIVSGRIFSLGLTNINMTIGMMGAGLAMQLSEGGVISHSYVEGTINAQHSIGGLAGIVMSDSLIINSYSKVALNSSGHVGDDLLSILGMNFDDHAAVGGLVALYAGGNIKNSHSYATITHAINPADVQSAGEIAGLDLSALVGMGEVEHVFYLDQNDITDAFAASQVGIQAKTPLEMSQAATFAAWDFARFWSQGETYPELQFVADTNYRFLGSVPDLCVSGAAGFAFSGGNGLSSSPLSISNVTQLRNATSYCLGMHAKLGQNIVLSDDFTPIEKQNAILDGGNRTISNWHYTTTYLAGEKIFALFKSNVGTIKNLNLIIKDLTPISNDIWVQGGLVGINSGKISNVKVTLNGTIHAQNDMPEDDEGSPEFMNVGTLTGLNEGIIQSTQVQISSTANLVADYSTNMGGAVGIHRGIIDALTVNFYGQMDGKDPNNNGGNTGGVIGYAGGDGTISANSSAVIHAGANLVSATWNLGGFLGQCSALSCAGTATIAGSLSGTTNYMGGFAGQTWEGTIENAHATISASGVILGNNYVGGLVGRNKTQGHTNGTAEIWGQLQGSSGRTGWLVGGNDNTGGTVNGTVTEIMGAIVQGNNGVAIPSTVILGEQL